MKRTTVLFVGALLCAVAVNAQRAKCTKHSDCGEYQICAKRICVYLPGFNPPAPMATLNQATVEIVMGPLTPDRVAYSERFQVEVERNLSDDFALMDVRDRPISRNSLPTGR